MSLQQQAAQQLVAIALNDPLNPRVTELLNEVISEYLDKGFYVSAIAESLDSTCAALPLEVSAVGRATILGRSEWDELIDEDFTPGAWDRMTVHLAASMAGSGDICIPILEATSALRDGGRVALAGVVNPAFDPPPPSELAWHPEINYPPVGSVVMLGETRTRDEVQTLGEPFVSGAEAQVWAVAALLGPEALLPWPEWKATLSWVASEEPLGSLPYWSWLISNISSGHLAEVFGTDGNWLDVAKWNAIVRDRLGYLLTQPTNADSDDRQNLNELTTVLLNTQWPAAERLRP